MKHCLSSSLSLSVALLILGGCTPKNEIISRTQCSTAIAEATQTWEVQYYVSKIDGDRRTRSFGKNTLANRDGEKPANAAASLDDNGVWWAALPPRPTADEVDQFRQPGELHDSPQLQRSVKYQLRCEDGTLLTDASIYREVARAVRSGQTATVSYSLNRALKVENTISPKAGTRPDAVEPTSPSPPPSVTTLHVDPQQGQDSDPGSLANPLKTITAALKQAGTNTTVQLRTGTYNTRSGETFPLQLKPGVTLQGNPESWGNGIVVQGGGRFLSPTWARQDATIVVVQGSQVQGITLTNQNQRGTAIWVETGSPAIERNTFVNNDREGVFVSGSAAPTIRNNRFERNGGNGISFTRDSRGVAEGNVIRTSGFGMAIGDRAAPEIRQNQIIDNLDGLVINGEARPVLSQNTITGNQRDGIVVTQTAAPRLQQNRISQNGAFDLNNATNRPLQLTGGDLAKLKVQGAIE